MGQYVPGNASSTSRSKVRRRLSQGFSSGESSTGPTHLRNINAEFIEPFQELASSFFVRLPTLLSTVKRHCFACFMSAFPDGFVEGLSQTIGLRDIDFLVSICEGLEYVAKRVDAELIGFLELVQLLIAFRDYWHSFLEMAASSPSLESMRGL
ncbi:hypothetical protein ACLOJK_034251 [Asimina triloba]